MTASAKHRIPASSGLGLAHQAIDPASLDCSLFEAAGPATALLEPQELHAPFGAEEPRISDGGGLTLGHLVDSVWEGLHAAGAAGCPVCGGRMERHGAEGSCTGCGSALT